MTRRTRDPAGRSNIALVLVLVPEGRNQQHGDTSKTSAVESSCWHIAETVRYKSKKFSHASVPRGICANMVSTAVLYGLSKAVTDSRNIWVPEEGAAREARWSGGGGHHYAANPILKFTRLQKLTSRFAQALSSGLEYPLSLSWRCATTHTHLRTLPPPPPPPGSAGPAAITEAMVLVRCSHFVSHVDVVDVCRVSIGSARRLHGLAACAPRIGTATSRSSSTLARMKRTFSRTKTTSGPCGMCVSELDCPAQQSSFKSRIHKEPAPRL